MEGQTEAVAPTLDSKLDRLFGGGEEAPPEATPEAEPAEQAAPVEASDEAAPAETPEPQEEVFEVEINGTKYQAPPELKDVLMKSADYTQKTQTLAQQRRELELQNQQLAIQKEESAFVQSVASEVDTLKMLEQYIPYVKANTNWDQLDVRQFQLKQKEITDLTEQYQSLTKSVEQKKAAFRDHVTQERQKLKKQASENLSKAIPGWNEKSQGEVEAYVKGLGYPDSALANMNSLDYQIAWKASQFDKLKSGAQPAVKKAASAPVIKASARQEMPSKVKEMLNVRKVLKRAEQGSPEQKAAVDKRIEQLFGG